MRQIGGVKFDHTPGPWRRRNGTSVIAGPKGQADVCIIVGAMVGGEFTTRRDAANAKLIEALPDLYAALELWHEHFDDTYDGEPLKAYEAALLDLYERTRSA